MSSSIDEKIVSLKFNNAQFEAGIKTTMSSLDGLKKTLNFEASIKSLNDLDSAGRKLATPKFDGKAFNDGIQTTVNASNKLKDNLKFDSAVKGLNDLDAAGKKVNLKLDPTQFQMGAKGVVDAANVIKQNLNFESIQRGFGGLKSSVQNLSFQSVVEGSKNAARSLGELNIAGKAVSFLPISEGSASAQQSISAMSIAGIAALAALGAKAAIVGVQMASNLILDPAKSGLAEYETNMNSIQTILANTQSKGSTITDVNAALEELNEYSDQTIYNFSEMARSIGTFTTAGVSLEDSTSSIKGLSNVAAMSGANATQAAGAMEQLSRAMSSGKVSLQDWMSIETAGMASESFRNSLMETARAQGKAVDSAIEKNGSFRLSLQDGWLTTDVMNETLKKFTGDLDDAQLKQMGYNDQQIKDIQTMATTASDAAQKVKTFTQLVGTLKETSGSGWAKSAQLILGDFEQAKVMWTNVNNVLGGMLKASADERNKLLGDWNAAGGRMELIGAVTAAFNALMGVLKPIGEAFREVFPPTTGQQLFELTRALRIFMQFLIPGEQATGLLKNTFKLLFTIIKIGVDIIKGALSVVYAFFKAFATGGDSIAGSMKPLTDALGLMAERIKNSKVVEQFFVNVAKAATIMGNTLRTIIGFIVNVLVAVYSVVESFISINNWSVIFARYWRLVGEAIDFVGASIRWVLGYLENLGITIREVAAAFAKGGIQAAVEAFGNSLTFMGSVGDIALTRITERIESIKRFADRLAVAWDQVSAAMGRMWDKLLPLRTAVSDLFTELGEKLKGVFSNVNYDDTLDMVNTGLLAGLVLLFKSTFKKMLGMGDGVKDKLMESLTGSVESINGVLESLSGTLGAMQQNLQADTLIKIAIAIGIMTISIIALSLIDSGKLTKSLVAIGVMVVILNKAMAALDKISVGSGFLKIPFIAASMILLAIALAILVIPVTMLSRMSWGELIKGLIGTILLIGALAKAAETMSEKPANLIATGIGLIAVAVAIKILASALKDIAELSFGDMVQGLIGVGVLLTALSIFNNMTEVNKGSFKTAAGLILLGTALKIMASALVDFAAMNISGMIQGLAMMAIVLALLQHFTLKVDGKDVFKTAAAMVILAIALKLMASALADFAGFSWEEIGKGLTVMSVALLAMSQALERTPKNIFASSLGFIAIAVSLKILASALREFAAMSWEDIAKAMTVLAGAMIILSMGLILMEDTIKGSYAMAIASASMVLMATALTMLGALSWEQLLVGLSALAGVFVIFGLAGLILSPIVPVIHALAIAMLLFGAGLLAVGLGTAIFVGGLIALTAAGLALGPAMVIIIGSILALIPLAMTELGKGIVAFSDVIGGAMPTFLNAFVALIETLLTAIDIVFPKLMDTLWKIIVGLVDLVVRGVPLFVDAGMKIIIGILEGVGNNMGKLLDAAYKIITEFIDGIARNIGQVIDSGGNLVLKFVEGITQWIRDNKRRMSDAGADLAGSIIDGMADGIANMAGRVLGAIGKVGEDALAEAARVLNINSPSKEFIKIGKSIDEGWAKGIDKNADMVTRATAGVGHAAIGLLKKTMASMSLKSGGDMDINPTIRPVLDLSAVEKDGAKISGMLTPPMLDISATRNTAETISERSRAATETRDSRDDSDTSSVVEQHITYVQNNTSPKALSRAEIYRDTKNHLSTIKKGALV